jgi:protein-S-isoprenylcysteine O-methyltransferase Ste14
MADTTPEQEAAYVPDLGSARSDLRPEAQLAHELIDEQRARTTDPAPIPPTANANATGEPIIASRWTAALGTTVFALIAQGIGVVLLPYAFTHWHLGTPPWPTAVRVIGAALIAVGGIVVTWAFAQFAGEGVGIPIPGEPSSQRLIVGGPYRYLRNPLYLASVLAISGQALLLSRLVLLIYAAAFLVVTILLTHWLEDPALARRFGQQFEDYRNQVPGWWPRLRRRTP